MATEFRPGGLKAVHYSATAAVDSWTQITGDPIEAEGLEEAYILQQKTDGNYQSGATLNPRVRFSDWDDYATVRAFGVGNARAKKFFAFEYFDGTILRNTEAQYPMARRMPKARRADGDSLWEVGFDLDSDTPYTEVAALTS